MSADAATTSPGWSANPEYVFEVEPLDAHLVGRVDGVTVVDTKRAIIALEQGHGSLYYYPIEDVRMDLLTKSDHGSYCQYKGFPTYWMLNLPDATIDPFAWTYDDPFHEVGMLKGYIGFYWHKADEWLEDGQPVSEARDIKGRVAAKTSFRALYPELAREWHPQKNPNIWPYEVAPFSRVAVWWKDADGREWQESVRARVLGQPNLKAGG